MTNKLDIDYEALADKIASDDWKPTGPGFSLTDLAEVRAFELLRREYEAAIEGAVRLTRHRGVRWSDLAEVLGVSEAEAIASYGERIGAEAEFAGSSAAPEVPADTAAVRDEVRCRDDAEARLTDAIERARAAGVEEAFIESVRTRPEEVARVTWAFPS